MHYEYKEGEMTQAEALRILRMGKNVYLTGPAGSGKTHALNRHIRYFLEREVTVGITASTGIAATHLGGRTIHSWAGIGINPTLSEKEIAKLAKSEELQERFSQTKVLIIDEISMLDASRFDLVDQVLRFITKKRKPFGGMQVVLCGDFFQLPPVSQRRESEAPFAYKSAAWNALKIQVCYLHEQYRQIDPDYLAVLRAIRNDAVSTDTMSYLHRRENAPIIGAPQVTKLHTHNVNVDEINDRELANIPGMPVSFIMEERGVPELVKDLKRWCLAPEKLQLKKDAFVMFVKNNFDKGYVNGTLGTIVGFTGSGYPVVRTFQGQDVVATPERWMIEEGGKVVAEIRQVPLRLAWAITIHKSQGMTLDAAEIYLSGAFEPGMGYVALSRLRSLETLSLRGWNEMAFEVNKEVSLFDRELRTQSEKVRRRLGKMSRDDIAKLEEAFLRAAGVLP